MALLRLLLLACSLVLPLVLRAAAQTEYDVVDTLSGAVRGQVLGAARVFYGIPYAQPPVGELRFASPRPAAPWAPATYDALALGPTCPGSLLQLVNSEAQGFALDEDCLHLSVYAPTRERVTRPLPVLFWIHGGAFVIGACRRASREGARRASREGARRASREGR